MNIRLSLTVVAVLLSLVGFWLLWPTVGVRGVLGLFLLLWGNNIGQGMKK